MRTDRLVVAATMVIQRVIDYGFLCHEQVQVGIALKDEVVPFAVKYFTGEANDDDRDGDSGQWEDEEEEEEGGGSGEDYDDDDDN